MRWRRFCTRRWKSWGAGMSEWQETTLGEIFKVKHGFAFKGEYFTDEPQRTALVTPGNFAIGGGFRDEKRKYYNGPVPEDYVLKPGQVVVTMTDLSKASDTLGYAASIPDDVIIWLHNQRVGLLEFKPAIPASPRFIQYLLRAHEYRSWVVGSATGTTVKHTSPGRIESFATRIPSIEVQHAIAHILGTLDDKIELNRRMNETLEAMAKATFQSWFVDFDPVRAKASGESTDSICQRLRHTPDLLALFPDSFEDSERGEIPVGWAISTIGTLANVTGGSTPNTKEPRYWEGGVHHWATPKDLSRLSSPVLLGTDRKVSDEGLAQIGSGLLEPGAVLLSSRAPIGYRAINEVPVAVNQGFIAMKPSLGVSKYFLLYWAEWAHDEIVSRANGSTFLEISKANFRPITVVRPPDEFFAKFDQYIEPLYKRIVSNEQETQLLMEQRDSLLPELLSGKILITSAEGTS
jgi:type I restriction enzyme S subunit